MNECAHMGSHEHMLFTLVHSHMSVCILPTPPHPPFPGAWRAHSDDCNENSQSAEQICAHEKKRLV